jgi:crossover junction endodeoxyribonuclease RuvC
MIILGFDPGLATVGYGVIEAERGKFRAVDYGVISTPKNEEAFFRLCMIYDGASKIIEKHGAEEIAIEQIFFQNNQKTAISVAEARGVLTLASAHKTGKIFEYTPLQVKQAITGYGRADKLQIQKMVAVLLCLKEIPKPDDAADALAIALCHAQTARYAK